jgi:hypothetical protein
MNTHAARSALTKEEALHNLGHWLNKVIGGIGSIMERRPRDECHVREVNGRGKLYKFHSEPYCIEVSANQWDDKAGDYDETWSCFVGITGSDVVSVMDSEEMKESPELREKLRRELGGLARMMDEGGSVRFWVPIVSEKAGDDRKPSPRDAADMRATAEELTRQLGEPGRTADGRLVWTI